MDCNLPGSSVHGIFQARGLEGIAIAFSEELHWVGSNSRGNLFYLQKGFATKGHRIWNKEGGALGPFNSQATQQVNVSLAPCRSACRQASGRLVQGELRIACLVGKQRHGRGLLESR